MNQGLDKRVEPEAKRPWEAVPCAASVLTSNVTASGCPELREGSTGGLELGFMRCAPWPYMGFWTPGFWTAQCCLPALFSFSRGSSPQILHFFIFLGVVFGIRKIMVKIYLIHFFN